MKNTPSNCCDRSAAQQLHSLNDVISRLDEHALPILNKRLDHEKLPVASALNRILAEDLVSSIDVPPADNSAVDGYAIDIENFDQDKSFIISQRIPAGQAPLPLEKGTAARIFTGASIPEGANCVIMQEQALLNSNENKVSFTTTPSINFYFSKHRFFFQCFYYS